VSSSVEQLDDFKLHREKTVDALLLSNARQVLGDKTVEQRLKEYTETKRRIDLNALVREFIGKEQKGKNVKVQDDLTSEYIFYDNFMQMLPRNDDLDSQLEFLERLKSLHKDVFGKEVEIGRKVDQLTTSSFENAAKKRKETKETSIRSHQVVVSKRGTDKSSSQVIAKQKSANSQVDYEFDLKSKSNNAELKSRNSQISSNVDNLRFTLAPKDGVDALEISSIAAKNESTRHRGKNQPSKSDQLKLENDKLEAEIEELSMIKEQLQQRLKDSGVSTHKNNSSILLPSFKTNNNVQELISMRNQRQFDIDEVNSKISRIKNTRLEESPINVSRTEKTFASVKKTDRNHSAILENNRKVHKPKSFNNNQLTLRTVEKSGSAFVNQMFSDISRVLNRGNKEPVVKNNSLIKSYNRDEDSDYM
jgi:hypothetical protein